MGETTGCFGEMDQANAHKGFRSSGAALDVDLKIAELDQMVSDASRVAREIQGQLNTLRSVVTRLRGYRRAQALKNQSRVNYITGQPEIKRS